MFEVKMFEVRDAGTFIPMMAVAMTAKQVGFGDKDQDSYLLRRAGYAIGERYIWFTGIAGGTDFGTYDPYDCKTRTRKVAHDFIIKNWNELVSGEVIDVEYILGITKERKQSERWTS